ncbi:YadA-like family protein [Paraburkholderia sp. Ac-20347]|uniref:YadA-like family protein n=1 Tax=Paraburkholderia sp. Ac-20347 TaxID=2703892 RepID=UPI001F125362|nr:YadA-like family protein [Paraburkholderia sp. Ac-20347]
MALGDASVASAASGIAMGASAKSTDAGGIAIGGTATAQGANSVALGYSATTSMYSAVAIGASAAALGNNAVAMGANASAVANGTAVGNGATVSSADGNNAGSAIGSLAYANGVSSAMGYKATAGGSWSTAFGPMANAGGASSAAVGYNANAAGASALAMGVGANASAGNTIAIGASAKSTVAGAIAIGQLSTSQGTNSIALGYNATSGSTSTADGNIAIGENASILNKGSGIIVMGRNARLKADGGTSSITGDGSIVIGDGASIFGTNSTAIGANTSSTYSGATLVGSGASSSVLGGGTALGQNASVSGSNAVALGGGSLANRANSVSVGAVGAERQVVNVAAGAVNSTSTDAVNGSQLYGVASSTASALGGGAAVNPDGSISNPTYVANGSTFNNVGGAISNLSGAVSNINSTVNNIVNGGGVKYFHTNSTLGDSWANGANSTAIGPVAVASYADDIAIGNGAAASRPAFGSQGGNVALGASASAQGYHSIAIGYGAQTNTGSLYTGASDIAIGQSTFAEGMNSVALGNNANVGTAGYDGNNVAVGSNSFAKASGAVAFGGTSTAAASNATAIGAAAYAGASGSTALGKASTASAANAIAIGNGANASVSNSVALGNGATTAAAVNTANGVIGGQTFTYAGAAPTGVVSVGAAGAERQVSNVAAGRVTSTSTDAVNGSQLYATNTQVTANTTSISNVQGSVTTLQGNVTTLQGQITNINGKLADAVLYDSSSHNSVTLGGVGATTNVKLTNVAAGTLSSTSADAVNGSQLYATNANVSNVSNTVNNIVNGSTGLKYFHTNSTLADSSATGTNATAIGPVASASASNAIAIGNGANASTANSVALGNGATTAAAVGTANGVIGGQTFTYAGATPTGVVSVGAAGAERQVTNVAAGRVSGTSTDAVNGSQLYATNTQVTANTTSISNVQGSVTTLQGQITSLNGKLADAVLYDSTSHNSVTLGGVGASTNVKLTNVAAGTLSSTSTDAVNGSQLYATNANVSNVSNTVNNIVNGGGGIKYVHTNSTLADSSATGTNATAIGPVASASAANAIAIGNGANASVSNSVALGNGATTAAAVGTANGVIGGQTFTYAGATPTGVVSVGAAGAERQVTNVAAGRVSGTSTDAVNGSQLYATNTQVTANTTSISNVQGAVTTLQGQITSLNGKLADAVLYDSTSHNSVTLGGVGASTNVKLTNVAAGTLSSTSTDAVNGSQLYATNANVSNVSNTVNNIVNGGGGIKYVHTNSTLADSSATGANATAIGPVASASATNAIAIGNGASASVSNSVALGNGATTAAAVGTANGVIGGQTFTYAGATPTGVVSVGAAGAERQVTNVAAGRVSGTSTDAVNGSQLYATNTQVTANTTSISNVQGAVTTLQGNVTTLQGDVSNLAGNITNLNGKLADAVLYDSSSHNSVTLGGVGASTNVKLTNVAAGTLSSTSTDAVNGSQLYATNSTVSNLAGDVTTLQGNMTTLQGDVSNIAGSITNINGQLADAVAYDSSAHDSVTLGGTDASAPVALHNVKEGELSSTSTDAVNGSQLYTTNTTVSNLAGDVTNLAGDVTSIDGRVTNIANEINNGSIGLVQQDATTHNITVAKDTDGTIVDFKGTAGTRVLTGVSAGELSSTSTDAVNGSQLYATNSTVSNLAGDVTTLQGNVTTLQGNVTTLQGDVTTLQGNMTTLQGDVSNIAGSITNINGQLADAVAYDSSAHDSVTLGGTDASAPVALHNVKEGELSSTSTDAVNGSQLYTTNSNVSNLAGDVTNLAGDVTSIDGRVTNIANEINNGSIGLVQQDATSHKITVAKDTDGTIVDFTGTAGTRVLTGVSAGELSSTSTDAVNGSQLYATNSTVSNLAGDVTTLQGNVTTLQGDVTTLQGNMTTLQGDVSNIAGSITNINGQLADAVAYDSSAHDSVTLGGTDASAPVALHNVKEGELSSTSTDAVNGSQLYTTNTTVSNLAGDVTNLAGDVTSIDGRVTNIANEINNGSIGLVQQDATTHTITVAKDTDGTVVDFTGTAGTRVLTGVSEGELSSTSTDAVNGSQLYTTNSTVSNLAGDVTTLQGNVTTLQGNVTTLQGNVTTLQGDVTTLQGNMTTLQGDVSNIAGSITNINGQLADAVAYDSSAHDSVTLGGTDASAPVALHNVKEGELSSTSTDAVNGSQLYTTNTTVSNLAGDVTNLAGDVTSIDGRVTNIANEINNGSIGLVQQDASTHNITVAKDTDGTVVDFTGTAGTRVLTGVSAGELSSTSTDAVNGSQLYATNSTVSNLAGDVTTLQGNVTTLQGNMTTLQGDVSNIAGSITNINGQLADAVMYDSTSHDSVTLGGKDASAPVALHNVKAGDISESSTDAVNGGQLYTTNSNVSNLAGDVTTLQGNVTTLQGNMTTLQGDVSNIAGSITNINGKLQDAVMYDSTSHDSVSLGGADASAPVALHNVKNGEVSASSFDAVNGSQLYALGSSTADALGGDSTVNADGSITKPTYKIGGSTYNNIGDSLTNIDGRVTNIANELDNGSIGLVQQDATSRNITVAKDTDGLRVNFAGTQGNRVLTGVAAGAVNATSVDAVNGSQLYATNMSVSNLAGTVTTLQGNFTTLQGNVTTLQGDVSNLQGSVTTLQGQMADVVSYDSTAHDSVTLGGSGASNAVALHNLAAGVEDSDAVNVGQMNAAISAVQNMAENATDPMFTASGDRNTEAAKASGTHATAGGANSLASGDNSTAMGAASQATGKNSTALGANSTASAEGAVALGAGSVADRDNTVSVGSAGGERQIVNVKAGTQGTDAVNVSQLNDAVLNAQSYTTQAVAQGVQQANAYTNQQIGQVRREMNSLGAAAMAASSLIPNARAEGNFQMAVAAGTYGGESALALGANWYVSDRLLLNAHVARSTGAGGSTGASVGATFGF